MTDLAMWSAIFLVSLCVLIKASDFFTDAAEKIGLAMGVPKFVIGVTIVAFGTSLPEIISSILAVLRGTSEIVAGNVIGSNIANIFLVLGVAAIVGKKLEIQFEIIHVDLPLMVSSAFFLAVIVWDGIVSFPEALLSLFGMVIYLHYTVVGQQQTGEGSEREKVGVRIWVGLIGGGLFIFLGADYTVESVIRLAEILDIGKEIVAVTAVALGTSLPELMVSISAVKKGNPELAVGNVLGSNVFNAFAVIGIPGMIGPLVIGQSILTFGLPMMLIGTVLCFFMIQERQMTHWEGWIFLLFYVFFIGKIFNLL